MHINCIRYTTTNTCMHGTNYMYIHTSSYELLRLNDTGQELLTRNWFDSLYPVPSFHTTIQNTLKLL